MRLPVSLGLSATVLATASPAFADSGSVTVEIPRVDAMVYRKPFVAVWLEDRSGKQVRTLAVFHDQTRIGARWLPELRTWWRKGGRALTMPADGISHPTRAPGRHTIPIGDLDTLSPGRYSVVVESAREKGGHEVVKVPFDWKRGKAAKGAAHGDAELGQVSVSIRPQS